ncbi:MAG: SDR family oxidoreductase [Ectothiorhodospiraceae bacterium]|nr:SDR family oxidoreductase [Ectothiorhodospiraceae bacterium]
MDLENRVVVVTGGARGIGLAVARRCLASGATVDLWDRDAAAITALLRAQDGARGLTGRVVDVTDLAAVERAADDTRAQHGRIDVLVNNAGFAGSTVPLERYDPEEWRRIVEVNLIGVFHCCRAVVGDMKAHGYGRVVNVASLAGKEGTPNASAYSAAKAGVIALTKSLGKELARTGVLVNCIAPAAVDTEILAQMSDQHVATMIAKSPMQRLGRVEEVAALVAWLASAECSFNTGAVFDLSGGRATY